MSTRRTLDEISVTDAVLDTFAGTPDPRLREVVQALVRHLHDFARDVQLIEDEWFRGIEFVTRTGHACSDTRQEFILLSDILGLSQLVVAQNHQRDPEATEQTVFGPFHVEGATPLPDGANIAETIEGEPLFVWALVTGIDGEPVPGATVDVWHADAEGLYDLQNPDWSPDSMKMRGVFTTGSDGRFGFQTIMPCAYPVPTDGPVGDLLRATARHAMRPAHIHFRVAAPGFDTLITHVFVDGDPFLQSDAVFGVRESCVARFEQHEPPETMPNGTAATTPFHTLDYTFRLQPLA